MRLQTMKFGARAKTEWLGVSTLSKLKPEDSSNQTSRPGIISGRHNFEEMRDN
jgi:hypothetical protein